MKRRNNVDLASVHVLAGACLAGLVGGCAEPTQLVVHVWTDLSVPTEVDQVRVRVSLVGEPTPTYDNTLPLPASGEMDFRTVVSFGAGPRGDDTSRRVQVQVDAMRDGVRLFTTEVRTGFARHKKLRLDVYLARRCLTQAALCLPSETCGLDGCVSPDVPVERLPPADTPAPTAPSDPRSPDGGAPDGGVPDGGSPDGSSPDDAGTAAVVRAIAPLSTSRVWTSAPTLRWVRSPGTIVAFELFRDAALVSNGAVDDDHIGAPTLTPGVYRWHVQPAGSTDWGPWWQFVVPPDTRGFDVSWGTFPDVNGDGRGDLVASQRPGSGAELIAMLATGGGSFTSPAAITALTESGQMRRVVACAGDINGDGYVDILVGAPTVAAGAGAVDVFSGSAALLERIPVTLPGMAGAALGTSVAPVGDVDGDGYGDVVVGAPGLARAFVYHGSAAGLGPGMPLSVAGSPADFGTAVAGADLDGDGRGDVLVSAPAGLGAGGIVYAFLSTGTGFMVPVLIADPSAGGDGPGFGTTLTSAGDIDRDGLGDVLVGHPSAPPAGHAWLVLGAALASPARWGTYAPSTSSSAGAALAGVGDVSGDARDDVVIGSPDAFGGWGYATVFDGTSTTELAPISGGATGDRLGAALAYLGDATGDGLDDLAIGVPGASAVYLASSPSLPGGAFTILRGPAEFGASIAGAQ